MGTIKIVKASAGSGKTYLLSYEYVSRVIKDPDVYKNILAVTFTNKATEEMKHRIIKEINDLANGIDKDGRLPAFLEELKKETGFSSSQIRERAIIARTRILHDYSRFSVMTIDKFFQRIIHAFFRELGIDNDVNLELKTEGVLSNAVDSLIEDSSKDPELRNWITELVDERIDDNKKWDFKSELVNLGKEIFTEEFRSLYNPPSDKKELNKILASVNEWLAKYSAKIKDTAQEAVNHLNTFGLSPDDFAYGRKGFINYFYELANGNINTPYGKRVSDALMSDEKWYSKSCKNKSEIISAIPVLKPILTDLCGNYDRNNKYVNTLLLIKENFRVFALFADISKKINDICNENNLMLISDTNRIINKLIENNDTPFIFEKAGNHYSNYMIDEFQDTSHSQWKNFIPLLENALSQDEGNSVLVVGDIKQSIYRWRGGNWDILGSGVEEKFSDSLPVSLDTNYRSKPDVIDFNNNLITRLADSENNLLNGILEDAAVNGQINGFVKNELTDLTQTAYKNSVQKTSGKNSGNSGYIKITEYEKDPEKGFDEEYFIEQIKEVQNRGYRASDIAVIVRYNYEATTIANILLKKKSSGNDGYCYDVVTQQALIIGNSPVVQFVISCMRIAANINRKVSEAVYLTFMGRMVHHTITDEELDFLRSIKTVSLEESFEMIVSRYDLGKDPDDTAYLQALHDQILSYSSSKISDMHLFLKWWEENGSAESINLPHGQNAITVITIHKAKGLQYPVVFMPYVSWNMDPNSRSIIWGNTDTEVVKQLGNYPLRYKKLLGSSFYAEYYLKELVYSHIDNLNLLYVAVTRAEDELHIFMESPRNLKSTTVNNSILRIIEVSDNNTVHIGNMEGTLTIEELRKIYEFGLKGINVDCGKQEQEKRMEILYPVTDFRGKLRLKTSADKLENTGNTMSSRNYGRIMHRVFESIVTSNDIDDVLKKLEFEGAISNSDIRPLSEKIGKALDNPYVASWFDGGWDKVRIENAVLVPSEIYKIKIPDRVMIKGKKAVVIDYKFGQKSDNRYIRQVRNYMYLLQQMGYEDINGYLWYVETGNIEEIEL